MKFDFLYHSYTLIITVFAAVFGMAYPLILQAIERIDTKYASSVLATDLRKRWQFKLFNYLIVTCILSVLVLAYVLEYTDSFQLKYVIVSIAAFFIATLMVDVVLLVQQIITYYSPEDLFNKLNKGTKNNKDANALLDLAKSNIRTAHSRIWLIEPIEASMADVPMVWIESMTTIWGLSSLTWSKIRSSDVSAHIYRFSGLPARRSARSLSWRALSSPEA